MKIRRNRFFPAQQVLQRDAAKCYLTVSFETTAQIYAEQQSSGFGNVITKFDFPFESAKFPNYTDSLFVL